MQFKLVCLYGKQEKKVIERSLGNVFEMDLEYNQIGKFNFEENLYDWLPCFVYKKVMKNSNKIKYFVVKFKNKPNCKKENGVKNVKSKLSLSHIRLFMVAANVRGFVQLGN